MNRGRGTQEIRPSNNPFFQTTSSSIGMVPAQRKEWQAPEVYRPAAKGNDGFFDFMFTKESDRIGDGVDASDSKLAETMKRADSLREVAKKKGEGLYPAKEAPPSQRVPPKPTVEQVLSVYEHQPKDQNPVYTTSNNVIGYKRPDPSTFTHERKFIAQAFSNSFNNVKYRNQGLNTSLTKSNIHSRLDPQFL